MCIRDRLYRSEWHAQLHPKGPTAHNIAGSAVGACRAPTPCLPFATAERPTHSERVPWHAQVVAHPLHGWEDTGRSLPLLAEMYRMLLIPRDSPQLANSAQVATTRFRVGTSVCSNNDVSMGCMALITSFCVSPWPGVNQLAFTAISCSDWRNGSFGDGGFSTCRATRGAELGP